MKETFAAFNKYLSVFCLSLCLWLASCTPVPSAGDITYTSFPQECVLQGEAVFLDTALFRYPFRIRVQGERAAVLDLHGMDHFVHLFSYPDFRYLASCAQRGEGPDEVLSGENIRWRQGTLQLLDPNKSELTCWRESADTLERSERVKFDEDVLRALDFVQLDDTSFLIPDYSGESRFCRVDRDGKILERWGSIPSSDKKALADARPALAQAWRSFVDYHPGNGVLAAVTQLGEVLEIWNLRDSTHVVRVGPGGEPEFRMAEGYGIPIGIMGFSDVVVGDRAIYAVFHGRSFRDIMQAAQKGESLPDGGKYLYVFSLSGEPLVRYELDHYIYSLFVDEKNQTFIATDVNADDPIWRYRWQ